MCGICGIFLSRNGIDIKEHILQINSVLKHRGPDDEGYLLANATCMKALSGKDTPEEVIYSLYTYCPKREITSYPENANLALGHRRLSILDTSAAGHQPMCSDDEKHWIVYNGEVYNYLELKEELRMLGYRFKTNTDTEVIIKAYQEWGKSCVDHFNGMWAFVIYDSEKQILFGSRDRLGVKPLYYYKEKDCFLFASEQKGLAKCKLVDTSINERAVFDYLVLSHSQAELEGFFKNIIELEAGCCFEYNLQTVTFSEYSFYSALNIEELSGDISDEEARTRLYSLAKNAVTIRTRSDVEVGACLSGGIDSSFIVMVLDQFFKEKKNSYAPKVFTAVYPGFEFDEEKWAKLVVENSNVVWHRTKPVADDFISDLQDMLYAADTPMLSTSTYAQYRVMKHANEQGTKVLLDGQGADELFAGYSHLNDIYYNELVTKIRLVTLLKEIGSGGNSYNKLKNWILSDVRFITQSLPSVLSRFLYEQSVFELRYIRSDFKNDYRNRFGKLHFPFGTDLNKVLKRFSSGEKLQAMLRLEDRMSMNFSVESRTPFADDVDLIEYGLSLPSKFKIREGTSKFIFREAGKHVLPREIYNRKDKIGFQTPEQSWLKQLHEKLPDLLNDNIREYIYPELLKADMKKLIDNPTSGMSSRLLRFVLLSQWRTVYGV